MIEEQSNNLLVIVSIYLIVIAVAFWGAMIIWTYRDMRARSRDPMAQIFAALLVAALPVAGLLIYLLLRPRESLAEAYERSLEEEALLQEIEEKPTCPGCGQRVIDGWQVCPHCHTRLKKQCAACKNMLELSWGICPYCTAPQPEYTIDNTVSVPSSSITDYAPARSRPDRRTRRREPSTSAQSLEFVDGDDS